MIPLTGAVGDSSVTDGGSGDIPLIANPWASVYDGQGNLIIADAINNVLRKVDLLSGDVSVYAGSGMGATVDGIGTLASFNQPNGIAADGQGHLFVGDADGVIRQVDLSTVMVHTVAGGAGGCTIGTGTAAGFGALAGISADGQGHLFAVDEFCFKVVEFDTTSWQETLVGGGGSQGCNHVDGPIASSAFAYPGQVTNANGSLYVTEIGSDFCDPSGGHTIRKIDLAAGMVSTIAGTAGTPGWVDGPGSSALFNLPEGLIFDSGGDAGVLYIADTGNDVLRKLDLGTNTVSTFAGQVGVNATADGPGATAEFAGPFSLAVDGHGTLFETENGDHLVRKIALADDWVTTLVGANSVAGFQNTDGGTARLGYPTGATYDGNGHLFVASNDNLIYEVDAATGNVTPFAGNGAGATVDGTGFNASFNGPAHMTSDGLGNLYVAQYDVIRKIVISTGQVTTVAGTEGGGGCGTGTGPTAQFNAIGSIEYDGNGHLFVANTFCFTVMQLDTTTWDESVLAGSGSCAYGDGPALSAQFCYAGYLTYDGNGNVYISDSGAPGDTSAGHTIRKLNLATAQVTTVAGVAGQRGSADGIGTAALFNQPGAIRFVPGVAGPGELFIADELNNTIRQLDLSTMAVTTPIGVAGSPGFQTGLLPGLIGVPTALALGPGPSLFIVDSGDYMLLVAR